MAATWRARILRLERIISDCTRRIVGVEKRSVGFCVKGLLCQLNGTIKNPVGEVIAFSDDQCECVVQMAAG